MKFYPHNNFYLENGEPITSYNKFLRDFIQHVKICRNVPNSNNIKITIRYIDHNDFVIFEYVKILDIFNILETDIILFEATIDYYFNMVRNEEFSNDVNFIYVYHDVL